MEFRGKNWRGRDHGAIIVRTVVLPLVGGIGHQPGVRPGVCGRDAGRAASPRALFPSGAVLAIFSLLCSSD